MKNSKGEILENTMEADPVSYLHGAGTIDPSLQVQLEGLQRGDRKNVYLHASPGLASDDFLFEVIIDDVTMPTEEEIILGYPVNRHAKKCEDDCTCYDNKN